LWLQELRLQGVARIRLLAPFCESRTKSIAQAPARQFVRVFGSMRTLRQCRSTVALPDRRYRIQELGQGTHRQTISDLLMTREPDGRGLLMQVRRGGSEVAPDLTETEAAA
jgi:hypothetical protein